MTASTEPVSDPVAIEKFYSPIEIAAMFGVVRRTVISWLKDPNHTLKGVKLGNNTWRVSETALKAFLKEKYGNPAA